MENNSENKEYIDVSELALEGVKQLIIRKGEALSLNHPKNVNISGTISAPSKFIKERKADFKKNKNYVEINREERTIVLRLNEQSEVGNYTVKGSIKLGNKFVSLGINNEEIVYTPLQLSKKLKMLRSIFPSKSEHAKIVATLRNLKATVNSKIDKEDDRRGNVKVDFEQTLESSMPESFKVKLPILEGEKDVSFDVTVVLEANSSQEIHCYLESIDAQDMIEKEIDKRIDEEIKLISEFAVVIEV